MEKGENKEVDNYYEFRKKRVMLFFWSRSGKALKDGAAPVMVRSRSRLEKVMHLRKIKKKNIREVERI